MTSVQVFVPHRAVPRTQPSWGEVQVSEVALNDAGTAVAGPAPMPGFPPAAASALPGVAARTAATASAVPMLPAVARTNLFIDASC